MRIRIRMRVVDFIVLKEKDGDSYIPFQFLVSIESSFPLSTKVSWKCSLGNNIHRFLASLIKFLFKQKGNE